MTCTAIHSFRPGAPPRRPGRPLATPSREHAGAGRAGQTVAPIPSPGQRPPAGPDDEDVVAQGTRS